MMMFKLYKRIMCEYCLQLWLCLHALLKTTQDGLSCVAQLSRGLTHTNTFAIITYKPWPHPVIRAYSVKIYVYTSRYVADIIVPIIVTYNAYTIDLFDKSRFWKKPVFWGHRCTHNSATSCCTCMWSAYISEFCHSTIHTVSVQTLTSSS